MTDRQDVQAAFGELLTIDSGDSLSTRSQVWSENMHGGDDDVPAVVKQTWHRPEPLEAWQRTLVARGIRTVAPLSPTVTRSQRAAGSTRRSGGGRIKVS